MFLRIYTIILPVLLLIFNEGKISAQYLSIKGRVTDPAGNAVGSAYLTVKSTYFGITDEIGEFSFSVPDTLAGQLIYVSHIGYKTKTVGIPSEKTFQRLLIVLEEDISALRNISVTAERSVSQSMISIPASEIRFLPSVSGGIEAVLKTLPGVNSANELSSQYSVRGGSFDENLVYVNDVEITRPFLIRSGQQEGLPFINPDLVESVNFSAGGFGPEYGDKLSSVLDVRYRDPDSMKFSVSPGLLLNSAHAEGSSANGRLKWLAGFRYKSTEMMLRSLDSEGDYNPSFTDFQSVISYCSGNWKASLLSTIAFNRYNFIPQSRTSTFGSESEAYRLFVLFRWNEKDRYSALNGVLTLENDNGRGFNNRLIASLFRTSESETFDIEGLYSLSTLDKNTGSENLTDTLINIGTASWLSHARSYLDAAVTSLQWRASYYWKRSEIKWGIKLQSQSANDRIKEWLRVDSAGFMIPSGSHGPEVSNLVSARNSLTGTTAEIFAASSNNFRTSLGSLSVSTGIRVSYSDITGETVASPRVSVKMKFNKGSAVWISGGFYIQPPFYREMRFPDGSLNNNVKSQKSVHLVSGYSLDFKAWERSFRFTAEAYNKSLYDIIPYRIDNVRLLYSGNNEAQGFSRGIDLRVNGEFVKGTESWFSLSVMQAKLEIPDMPGVKFPAPNDQRFKVSIFFQDWLPSDPSWNFHLNLIYSSGLPVTSPFNERYDQYHRIPPYRRVDMGITKNIALSVLRSKKSNPFFRELVFGAEIFNLLDIHNTVSYLWIETVNNLSGSKRVFAIPNYLTGRSLNLKLRAEF